MVPGTWYYVLMLPTVPQGVREGRGREGHERHQAGAMFLDVSNLKRGNENVLQ